MNGAINNIWLKLLRDAWCEEDGTAALGNPRLVQISVEKGRKDK